MKNISVEVERFIKDENDMWVCASGDVEIKCEDGKEACGESMISIGANTVRISELVEFLQLIDVLSEDCWR